MMVQNFHGELRCCPSEYVLRILSLAIFDVDVLTKIDILHFLLDEGQVLCRYICCDFHL